MSPKSRPKGDGIVLQVDFKDGSTENVLWPSRNLMQWPREGTLDVLRMRRHGPRIETSIDLSMVADITVLAVNGGSG